MSVAESQVATLKDGDYFGKNALLRGEPRTATIKAKTDLSTFKITRTEFEELGLREKLDFPQRKAVGGGAVGERQLKPPSPRTPEERRLMLEALTDDVNLQKCVPLDGPKMDLLIDTAWRRTSPRASRSSRRGISMQILLHCAIMGPAEGAILWVLPVRETCESLQWDEAVEVCLAQCERKADILVFNFDSDLINGQSAMGKFMR